MAALPTVPEQTTPSFAEAVAALRDELRGSLGAEDVRHLRRMHHLARATKWGGRALAAILPGPAGPVLGGVVVGVAKLVAMGPLGHDVYHGAWEQVPGAERYARDAWRWDAPVGREVWLQMHNQRHHAHTAVAHRDYDNQFAFVRMNPHVEPDAVTRWQGWIGVASVPFFTHVGHLQYQGVLDGLAVRVGHRPARGTPRPLGEALRAWARVSAPYVADHYLIGPLVFGFLAPRVVVAELIGGRIRDAALWYFAFATHAGHDNAWKPEDHRPDGREGWLRDHIAATYNTRLPRWASLILDAADFHIEHHVFPQLPSHRLRDASVALRELCEAHGVPYRVEPASRRIRRTVGEMFRLARPHAA